MTNEIENLIKKIALRDVQVAVLKAQEKDAISESDMNCFMNIIKEVEKSFN